MMLSPPLPLSCVSHCVTVRKLLHFYALICQFILKQKDADLIWLLWCLIPHYKVL